MDKFPRDPHPLEHQPDATAVSPLELDDVSSTAQDARRRAREWLVLIDSDEATGEDQQRLEHWLNLDPQHRLAFQQVQAVWQASSSLQALKSLEPLKTATPPNTTRSRAAPRQWWQQWQRALMPAGIALATVVILVAVVLQMPAETPQSWSYHTQVAQRQTINLPDGSTVTLGPKSSLQIRYSHDQRHVKLQTGEAFFNVARNPNRPFIVDSLYTQVKVLGTMFNVNNSSYGVTVAVEEGHVQVSGKSLSGPDTERKELLAGQRVRVSQQQGLEPLENITPSSAGVWRQNLRVYQSRPLAEVLEDLGRYQQAKLTVQDPHLKALPVTAVFPTDNIDTILLALETVLPVSIVYISPEHIDIRAR
ncbi:FecR family protein [Aestuariicella hydrocarbonica]|uniref:FecR family protein n=1 Tax=Pseudomaricurvus hydrocarbonicus TaxID=1470433 RepID=A0A9E5T4D2_9GAMM|nr:FecR family protein [Aestuariicella hydrocarbonica]NHO67892.1 FecR family protein [Aestuariicella hydrocarbonica]